MTTPNTPGGRVFSVGPAATAWSRPGQEAQLGAHNAPPLAVHDSESPWPQNQVGALVIGAGITGWTTALVLARRGWQVVLAADRFGIEAVSTADSALWEWPSSPCDRRSNHKMLDRSAAWAMRSYLRFCQLAPNSRTGVSLRTAVFHFTRPVEEDPTEFAKMVEIERHVPGYVHDPTLIDAHGVSPDAGVVDAYSYLAPTIDTDWYLTWLAREAEAAGVTAVVRRIRGPLVEQEERLRVEHGAEVIINCTGLGARELAADPSVHPRPEALLRIVNDGPRAPRVTAAHVMKNPPHADTETPIYVVPRGVHRLLLGGPVEPVHHDIDPSLANHPSLQRMLDRWTEVLPALRGARLDDLDPLRVGVQPFRPGGVRLETQPGTRIVHNYGHGAAGVTLSWGCAQEVADLACAVLAKRWVKP
ncbi:FAD-binding oxidoreductase [Mycobacterium simiae]|uniref:FAD-binding oxidoreductase n=1 Tax=Mycobacterium simiae TaxID=1784 RepID=A0A5B1BML9_MYCSI|nr:FAD-dependent oxidoreductase [Mycobacterium simiae]KAA1249341.1 FAD-binding oxidoreductase [Mycobacterium simiae]